MNYEERKALREAIDLLEIAYRDINQQMGLEIREAINKIKWVLV